MKYGSLVEVDKLLNPAFLFYLVRVPVLIDMDWRSIKLLIIMAFRWSKGTVGKGGKGKGGNFHSPPVF